MGEEAYWMLAVWSFFLQAALSAASKIAPNVEDDVCVLGIRLPCIPPYGAYSPGITVSRHRYHKECLVSAGCMNIAVPLQYAKLTGYRS